MLKVGAMKKPKQSPPSALLLSVMIFAFKPASPGAYNVELSGPLQLGVATRAIKPSWAALLNLFVPVSDAFFFFFLFRKQSWLAGMSRE